MVQEFYILKCSTCTFFQVHIVKKAKTWACKMCGLKQSIIKVYGQGSAKECRVNVQKLNEKYQSKHETVLEEIAANAFNDLDDNSPHPSIVEDNNFEDRSERTFQKGFLNPLSTGAIAIKKSKWSAYLDEEPEQTQEVKKCKWVSDTDSVLERITFLENVENQDEDTIRTERSSLKPTGIQNDPSTSSRLRSTEELLKSLSAGGNLNAAESSNRGNDYGSENDEKYFNRGKRKLKTENSLSTNSLDLETRVTKISSVFLSDEDDIDSILNL